MADGVFIPVTVEVTDIDTSKLSGADFNKQIESSVSGIKSAFENALKGLDMSKLSAPMKTTAANMEKNLTKVVAMFNTYNSELESAGKKTTQYKDAVRDLFGQASKYASYIGGVADQISDKQVVTWYDGTRKTMREIRDEYAQIQKEASKASAKPFAQYGSEEDLGKINVAYRNLMQAIQAVNNEGAKLNQQTADSPFTDQYAKAVTDAERLKSQLQQMNVKSKEMEALGTGTEKSWATIEYRVTDTAKQLETVVANMRDMVSAGEAFRIGNGTADQRKENTAMLNSLSMTGRDIQSAVHNRAQDNMSQWSEEYNNLNTEAERLRSKLQQLNAQSKEMDALGTGTEASWNKIDYRVADTAQQLDDIVKSMREMVKSGDAFRFGNGSGGLKAEARNRINGLALTSRNIRSAVANRTANNLPEFSKDYRQLMTDMDAVEKKVEGIQTKLEKMRLNGATEKEWNNLTVDAANLEKELDAIGVKMQNMVGDGSAFNIKPTVEQATAETDRLSSSIQQIKSSLDIANSGVTVYYDSYKNKVAELIKLQNRQRNLAARAERIGQMGGSTRAWANIIMQAGQLDEKIKAITKELEEMVNKGEAFRVGGDAGTELARIEETAGQTADVFDRVRISARTVGNVVVKAMNKIAAVCKKVRNALWKVAKQFMSLTKHSKKSTDSISKSINKLWKNVLQFGLGFRSVYYLIKRLRTALINEFKAMAEQNPEVNDQISAFMTALNQLKGAFASAFQPVVSVVLPALTKLMNALSSAMEVLAKFFATLTGQGYYYKFTADQVDYAASLEDTASAAEDAQHALMGFDEINRLDDKSDSGSDSGNSAGGTWSQEALTGSSKLAELIKEGWAKSDFTEVGTYIGEWLKNALAVAQDWIEGPALDLGIKLGDVVSSFVNSLIAVEGLSEQIGNTIGAALNTIVASLNNLYEKTDFVGIGQFIADALMTGIKKVQWKEVGELLGNKLRSVIEIAWGFVTDIEWDTLGQSISEAISGFFERMGEVNKETGMTGWETAGDAVNTAINGFLVALTEALEGHGDEAGSAIGQFFSMIDWKQITMNLSGLVEAILSNLKDAMDEWSDEAPLSAFVAKLIGFITVAPTLLSVIGKIVKSITSLTLAFKLFKIAASTGLFPQLTTLLTKLTAIGNVLKTIGGYLGAGALGAVIGGGIGKFIDNNIMANVVQDEGLADAYKNFSWFGEDGAFSVISEAFENGYGQCETFSEKLELFTSEWSDILTGWKDKIVEQWGVLTGNISEFWNDLVSNSKEQFAQISEEWQTRWDNMQEKIDEFKENVSEKWDSIKEKTEETWDTVSTKVSTKIEEVRSTVQTKLATVREDWSTKWTNMQTKHQEFWANVRAKKDEGINNLKSSIITGITTIKSKWDTTWSNIKEKFINIWNSIKTTLKSVINSIIGFLNGMIRGVVSGINAVIGVLNNLEVHIPDWVPLFGGKSIGFSIGTLSAPQIPYLAQGAVIPPNKQFLAMLGDQKSGTNVEAPLSTIQEAVATVMDEQLDALAAMAEAIVAAIENKDTSVIIGDKAIGQAANRYNHKQQLLRGV